MNRIPNSIELLYLLPQWAQSRYSFLPDQNRDKRQPKPHSGDIARMQGFALIIWSPYFFLYVVLVETVGAIIPIYYLSIQIYKKFEDRVLQKKWKFFIYGFTALVIFMYGIFISNFLNNATFRLIMGIVGLILALGGGYMIYYGVGRSLSK